MASISTNPDGNRCVQFAGLDGRRKTIRLGKHPKRVVEVVKARVEQLLALAAAKLPHDADLSAWVGGISDELHGKLAACGLVEPRRSSRLGEFLGGFMAAREKDGTKPGTVTSMKRTVDDLIEQLGAGAELRKIGPVEANAFTEWCQANHGRATVAREIRRARQLFAHAVELRLIGENPFARVKVKDTSSPARQEYVPAEWAERMIEVANGVWKTVIALCRFGGLRCASEVLTIEWADVDFAAGRMRVRSPKTEHHEGRDERICPIFARLRPHLEEARALAPGGVGHVIGGATGDGYRDAARLPDGRWEWKNSNMRTTMLKIVKRAGLKPWPRLFNNLRSSLETDLMESHPIQVVTAWLGNTPQVALKHYLQTLDSDFEKAIRGDVKSDAKATQKPTVIQHDEKRPKATLSVFCPENEGKSDGGSPEVAEGRGKEIARRGIEPLLSG